MDNALRIFYACIFATMKILPIFASEILMSMNKFKLTYNMKQLNIILAVLLLLCLFKMPYGYYTLMRLAATVGFAYMAYRYYEIKKEALVWTFGALALLFQPLVKIALGRDVWNIVDVAVAVLLIVLTFAVNKKTIEKN